MHSRSNTIIGAGVAIAILGALLVFMYARSVQGSAGAAPGRTTGAYVAAAPIASGTKGDAISASLKLTTVPALARPADAVTSLTQLAGQASLRNINPGEVISASQFGAAGTPSTDTGGLAIPAGHDAITITTPVPHAVAGFVSPGDQVNIFMTTKDPNQSARLLLSNVQVLATVPANTPKLATPAPATGDVFFTLSLTPQDAEKIIFAQTYDSLYFGLIHPGDGPASSGGQTQPTLFK